MRIKYTKRKNIFKIKTKTKQYSYLQWWEGVPVVQSLTCWTATSTFSHAITFNFGPWKRYEHLNTPSYGLNSATTGFLKGLLHHYIIYKV